MKCEQCGFLVDSLPEGGGEYLCPNCGWVMRKAAPGSASGNASAPDATASATHLKIARTVNVGFGDFASTLAATDASKITPTDSHRDIPDRTRTASASTLNVEEPDDDDVLSQLDVYDEDDEYARIQAEISARQKALDERAAELDVREKHLNKKLDEIIAEKEFLRTGIEKNDEERASYLKQKSMLDAQRADMEKEIAARKASLDARAAEIEKKTEAMNNRLERTARIQKRILIGLAVLAAVLIVLLFVKESELRRARTAPEQKPPAASIGIIGGADGPTAVFLSSELLKKFGQSAESVSAPTADTPTTEQHPAPESENSGGGL